MLWGVLVFAGLVVLVVGIPVLVSWLSRRVCLVQYAPQPRPTLHVASVRARQSPWPVAPSPAGAISERRIIRGELEQR